MERFVVKMGDDSWTILDREHAEEFVKNKGGNGEIIRLVPESEIAAKDAEIERLRGEVAEEAASKNDAYRERNTIVAALARMFPSGIRRTDIPGWDAEWHGCVFIDTPQGQMSWHYHDSDAALFSDLPPYTKEWDGHSTPEKYARLARIGNAVAAAVAREREELLAALSQQRAIEEKHGTSGGYGLGLAQAIVRARPTPGAAKEV